VPILLRGIPLILFLFRMWRKLPASQKRQVLRVLGRHGPRVAARFAQRARARRRFVRKTGIR
jgi:hypothetical protein